MNITIQGISTTKIISFKTVRKDYSRYFWSVSFGFVAEFHVCQYLNDTPEGDGCTYFPKLNLKVQPKKNSLLIFPNFRSDGFPSYFVRTQFYLGNIDDRVTHIAEEIMEENVTKFGMNIWILNANSDDGGDSDYSPGS